MKLNKIVRISCFIYIQALLSSFRFGSNATSESEPVNDHIFDASQVAGPMFLHEVGGNIGKYLSLQPMIYYLVELFLYSLPPSLPPSLSAHGLYTLHSFHLLLISLTNILTNSLTHSLSLPPPLSLLPSLS